MVAGSHSLLQWSARCSLQHLKRSRRCSTRAPPAGSRCPSLGPRRGAGARTQTLLFSSHFLLLFCCYSPFCFLYAFYHILFPASYFVCVCLLSFFLLSLSSYTHTHTRTFVCSFDSSISKMYKGCWLLWILLYLYI